MICEEAEWRVWAAQAAAANPNDLTYLESPTGEWRLYDDETGALMFEGAS